MKFALAVALCLVSGEPAFACSGYPTRYFQSEADVIVAGSLARLSTADKQAVVTGRVLKGVKLPTYPIVWPVVSLNDECAFLSPIFRERGVFFLKRRTGGTYEVLKTEKRWKMIP